MKRLFNRGNKRTERCWLPLAGLRICHHCRSVFSGGMDCPKCGREDSAVVEQLLHHTGEIRVS